MNRPKLAIHTDVLVEYLIHHGTNASVLRAAMMKFFCYTTVFNAIELFALASNDRERKAVAASMSAMKILGLNGKQAARYGSLLAAHPRLRPVSVLVAGICIESKLPLLAYNTTEFRGFRGLKLIGASLVTDDASAERILASGRMV